MSKIKIKQIRSRIGRPKDQKRTLDALGLRKMHQIVEHNLTPQIQGMAARSLNSSYFTLSVNNNFFSNINVGNIVYDYAFLVLVFGKNPFAKLYFVVFCFLIIQFIIRIYCVKAICFFIQVEN